ncbi:hypothetical protein BDV93DRAFT_608445 [Ceratobasidium sp. AG-I]|nr:hypothetical protein BDV93DRAFT_608445 [Ceratobasidium sp. AG-I]
MSRTSATTHTHTTAANGFAWANGTLLYAGVPRVSPSELRRLLGRGSGFVVRGTQKPKVWFQAQCAHYGLPTHGTLAALRNHLDRALEEGGLGVPEEIKRPERIEPENGPCGVCEKRNAAKVAEQKTKQTVGRTNIQAIPAITRENPVAKSARNPLSPRKALTVKTDILSMLQARSKHTVALPGMAENKAAGFAVLKDSNRLTPKRTQDPVLSPVSPRGILVARSNVPSTPKVFNYDKGLHREAESKAPSVAIVTDSSKLMVKNVQDPTLSPVSPRGILVLNSKFDTSLSGAVHLSKSVRWDPELEALEEIKLRMGFPEASDTETESDYGDSSSCYSVDEFTPPGLCSSPVALSYASLTKHNQLQADTISGMWSLRVTCHNILPLPGPWRSASSTWLKGDMNVLLSADARSLSAEFALLGMHGVIKSRKFEPRKDGVHAWVKFVARMPITTGEGGRDHACVFGPSEMQYGYVRFGGNGKVRGMLRCRQYGRIEFAGTREGRPITMRSSWDDFVG